MQNTNEIVLYQPDAVTQLEVRLENETVWLTQAQMAILFETTRNNITLHIRNIFDEQELDKNSVCKDFLLTAADGKKYHTLFYNLDVIISVGYRVKSKRGTKFRQWALGVLKDYILRGYAVNQRFMQLKEEVNNRFELVEGKLKDHQEKIDFFVRTALPPVEGVFYEGQMFEPFEFINKLVRSAKHRIVLIDNYVDDTVLLRFAEREDTVTATIYTQQTSPSFALALQKHNAQYPPITVHHFTKSHDRFLIIDDDVYHIGASIKDLGKRWFAFCKMQMAATEILGRL
ncbi:MAG: virulence RhuM family protein [Paludibacteraceae bacterium]|nr:virulence RhuM family protein [Paludibacteraceae bacterium]